MNDDWFNIKDEWWMMNVDWWMMNDKWWMPDEWTFSSATVRAEFVRIMSDG